LMLEEQSKKTLAPIHIDRDFVLQHTALIALVADKDSDKLKALDMLGRSVGIDLFRDTVVHEKVTSTPAQVEEQLRDKLEALRRELGGDTIEGTAKPVSDPPGGTGKKAPR
jgi:hypothetical protein